LASAVALAAVRSESKEDWRKFIPGIEAEFGFA